MFIYRYFSAKFSPKLRTDNLIYADLSSRYIAVLADMLIVIGIIKVFYGLLMIIPYSWLGAGVDQELLYKYKFNLNLSEEEVLSIKKLKIKSILINLFGFVMIGAYFISSWYYLGGSIGNILFGLRVMKEQKSDSKDDSNSSIIVKNLSLADCFKRLLAMSLTGLTLFIGFFSSFFDSKRQALHDKLASTIIVTKKSLQANDLYCPRLDLLEEYVKPFFKRIFVLLKIKKS